MTLKQQIDFLCNGKTYDVLLQPTDWRYSAAVVGLVKFFVEEGIDYLVLDNLDDKPQGYIKGFDGIIYNQSDITEEAFFNFAESYFFDYMTHITLEELLKADEFDKDSIKEINDLAKSKTVLKKVFGKTKFDGTNANEFLDLIEENRLEIIKSIFRYGKNMYADYCNSNLLSTQANKHCRLVGYTVDEGRKGKSLGFCFDKNSFVGNDIPEFDFIPFAFSNPSMYETYFVNNNYSVRTLVETNRDMQRRLEDIDGNDAKNKLLTVLKNAKDFIDYDVEIISKNRDEEQYKTLFVRAERLKYLQKLQNTKLKFTYKINDGYYFNLDNEVYEKCLNNELLDDTILFIMKATFKDENVEGYVSYVVDKLININLNWKGLDKVLEQDIKMARAAGINTAKKLRDMKAENKIVSFQQKIISSLNAHDYDRVKEIILKLSAYSQVEYGFFYKFLENAEEYKDLAFAFASALKLKEDKKDTEE